MIKNTTDKAIDVLEEDSIFPEYTGVETVHPWRICPIGKHYVRTHTERIPPSKKHPEGETTIRHAHCAENPSHKDMLSFDEIQEITKKYFASLSGPPSSGVLTEFDKSDNYDDLIRGWVRYWNDIFHSQNPLDANFIKSLIATESGFDSKTDNKVNKKVHAHGLMQIRNETRDYLSDHKGELSNYLVMKHMIIYMILRQIFVLACDGFLGKK